MFHELDIEKVIWRGRGLSHLESGKAVIVVGGVFPGERVRVKVIREKRDFVEGVLEEVLIPHPARRNHPCPLSEDCGGCRWGGVWEWFQVSLKKKLLIDELTHKIKGFFYPFHKIDVFLSPDFWRYRFRAQIHVKDNRPCFKKLNSGEFVELRDCLLLDKRLSDYMFEASKRLPDGRFVISLSPLNGKGFLEKDRALIKLPLDKFGAYLLVYPSSFFQANWKLNEHLIEFVVSKLANFNKIADLYAGACNFSIPFAVKGKETVAFEIDSFSVESSKKCAEALKLSNLRVFKWDVTKEPPVSFLKGFMPDAAIIDPPRSGCGKKIVMLDDILSLKRMIWVSCDVINTIRDIKPFFDRGWKIKDIAIFDMFPQTWHMETVFFLEK